ncbi:GNAT family N-acetyltransferase [Paenibacillus sp. OAS669]|uniref:GNAT family N-acetyltransferase n=1 Tax=Paenibacillus sp. OAS669 TaxID=2663821 RepID=UPI00178AE963|nr:GNAT family N-acetyltransferase [Paenibacillus sp. OAS669]MBE1440746.1 ribosomal protein S18 acetylase RimI-like enzyme [Paenibacillus sp. OAS669]
MRNGQDMQIEQIGDNELDSITELYNDVTRHMRKQGIDQWDQYYPTKPVFQNDLLNGHLYGIRKDWQWIGAVAVNEEQDTAFEGLPWQDPSGSWMVIHRLAVHPDYQGRGIGKKLLLFAEAEAVKKGYTSIRLDAYSANPSAVGMYEKAGYNRIGEVRYPFRKYPFHVYEKMISPELRPS